MLQAVKETQAWRKFAARNAARDQRPRLHRRQLDAYSGGPEFLASHQEDTCRLEKLQPIPRRSQEGRP